MDFEEIREYCLSLPMTEETTPFDEETLVYKVCGKMFLMTGLEDLCTIAVKLDPERALDLREEYTEITPAYHMNKRHWNNVKTNGDLPASLIRKLIKESYDLVVAGLPKATREGMEQPNW